MTERKYRILVDARDAALVSRAVAALNLCYFEYREPRPFRILVPFSDETQSLLFRITNPDGTFDEQGFAVFKPSSAASVRATADTLSPSPKVIDLHTAWLECLDEATELAFNAALHDLAKDFVGEVPMLPRAGWVWTSLTC